MLNLSSTLKTNKAQSSNAKRSLLTASAILALTIPQITYAQEASSFGDSFAVPVFDQVDSNGVDLISGSLRVQSPVEVTGSESTRRALGLQWVGGAWSFIDSPSIWRDGRKYIVNYNGRSAEFRSNGNATNYIEQKPISGETLICSVFLPSRLNAGCIFTSKEGDVVSFIGIPSPFAQTLPNVGHLGFRFGNMTMTAVVVESQDKGNRSYGVGAGFFDNLLYDIDYQIPASGFGLTNSLGLYNDRDVTLILRAAYRTADDLRIRNAGRLEISTPNHNGRDDDEHFLRPRNTVQSITNSAGSTWRYTINKDRLMTKIQLPGGFANTEITYDKDDRVSSVTNADGTWRYSYTRNGDWGTTTVTNPLGETTYVKYNEEEGFITESRDDLNRTTRYTYDSGFRVTRVTYPEGNYVAFTYDARGNITSQTQGPKSGSNRLVARAAYPTQCTDPITCNRPIYTIDARGARTDFEYESSVDSEIRTSHPRNRFPIKIGHGGPIKVTLPAPSSGAARPQIRNVYENGVLISTSSCISKSSCSGDADEIITTYDYGGTNVSGGSRFLYGMAVTSGGKTLRTCYGYDLHGRRISETQPLANISVCPKELARVASDTLPTAGTTPAPTQTGNTPPSGGGGGGGGGGGVLNPNVVIK